jgi:Tol biopolymer transport system component
VNKYLTHLLLIAILLTACGPAVHPSLPIVTVTQTITPSQTPRPTQTVIPTETPFPSLKTEGPYLLFTYDNKNFTIMNADGSGRKQFQLPNDGYIHQLNMSVSPDGKQLAYFTGSIEEPYDITLNLLNLSDETTQPISNLLAQDFPANLEPIVETMVLGDPPNYDSDCFQSMECRRSLVERELINSLFVFDWSPDSQSIAFTAQIDEPSSDIYVYSIQDKTIYQLTNEPQNIYWLDWAPNGKRILYEICSTPGTGYEGRTLHVTDFEGKTVFVDDESLYYQRWGESGWLTENLYLFDHPNDTDKPPIYDLMIVNTDTGQLKEIWPYSLDAYAVNTDTAHFDGRSKTISDFLTGLQWTNPQYQQ